MPETEVKKSRVNKRMDSALKPVEFSVPQEAQAAKKKYVHPGQPTTYSLEIATKICGLIADGLPLRTITRMEDMPTSSTVYLWLATHEEFSDMYTRAREDQADALADEIIAISEEKPMLRIVTDSETIEKLDPTGVSHNRNRIDARKWVAAKLKPRKYGDRQILAGDADNPVAVKDVTLFDELVKNLELTRQKSKG